MARLSWVAQTRVLLLRNWRIKRRNRGQLLAEVLFPAYLFAVVGVAFLLSKTEHFPAMLQFPSSNLTLPTGTQAPLVLCYAPNSSRLAHDIMAAVTPPFLPSGTLVILEGYHSGADMEVRVLSN